jgi:hypothetical protein
VRDCRFQDDGSFGAAQLAPRRNVETAGCGRHAETCAFLVPKVRQQPQPFVLGLRFAASVWGEVQPGLRIRLIKKLAEWIDGVDLRAHAPGDVLNLSRSEAQLLLAEGWAVKEYPLTATARRRRSVSGVTHPSALTAEHLLPERRKSPVKLHQTSPNPKNP